MKMMGYRKAAIKPVAPPSRISISLADPLFSTRHDVRLSLPGLRIKP
jgi:hypothetical protein